MIGRKRKQEPKEEKKLPHLWSSSDEEMFELTAEYDKQFVDRLKELVPYHQRSANLGLGWVANAKVWRLHSDCYDDVTTLCQEFYGGYTEDGEEDEEE
jgi:hypothetical protein